MFKTFGIFWVLFVSLVNGLVSPGIDRRVIGGASAPHRRILSVVSIRGDDPNGQMSTFCGATLIHESWLLTAAHCFTGKASDGKMYTRPKLWHVQWGSNKISINWGEMNKSVMMNTKLTHKHVKLIVLHPNYVPGKLEYDIALMKLVKPLTDHHKADTAYLPPATKAYLSWPEVKDICFLVGWGCLKVNGFAVPDARIVQLNVTSNRYCSELYNHGADLNPYHEFCAGFHKKNKGICPGDSGSGLYCLSGSKLVMQGIASATHKNYPESFPGLFTRVSIFRKWIELIIGTY